MDEVPAIVITSGEPAGIGPELCAMLAIRHAQQRYAARLIVIGDRRLLDERASRIGLAPGYVEFDPMTTSHHDGRVEVWHAALAAPVVAGSPDPANASSVVTMLARAC